MGNGKGGNLPATCTSFLKEWYANDREQIHSKYTDKGNYVEHDLIEMMADVLNFGMAEKNEETRFDEYLIGTCDVVLPELVVDVKAPWNIKTLQSNVEGMDSDYEWQGRGYMRLWDKPRFILFYGLMDTPEDVNFGFEISYQDIPMDQKWIGYEITRNPLLEEAIIERVKLCREWLVKYDKLVQSKIGKLHLI
jgi:hypothetical protein